MRKHYEIELNISPEEAWQKLAVEFADIGKWTSLLSSSYMQNKIAIGSTRVCMVGNQKSTEIITQYDAQAMLLAYKATSGVPSWMTAAENHYQIKSLGEHKSLVISNPIIKVKWWVVPILPLMSFMLDIIVNKAFSEFKYWAETGNPHPKKIISDAKFQKSQ